MIYFIQAGAADGPVKIGTTNNLAMRVASIAGSNHEAISVLATVGGGTAVEAKFHRLLKDHRIRGEWFAWCPAVEAAVDLAKRGELPDFPAEYRREMRRAEAHCLPAEGGATEGDPIPHPDVLRNRLRSSGINDTAAMDLLRAMGCEMCRKTLYNFRHGRGAPTMATVAAVAAMLDFAAQRASNEAA